MAGPSPRTTLILRRAWAVMASVMPAAISLSDGFGVRKAIVSPLHRKAKKRKRVKVAPTSPTSSPRMAKMKSVWA